MRACVRLKASRRSSRGLSKEAVRLRVGQKEKSNEGYEDDDDDGVEDLDDDPKAGIQYM